MCLVEGRNVSEVAREFNLSRTTVYKYLNESNEPNEPVYQRSVPIVCPKLESFKPQLIEWLELDATRSVRARRTAVQLYEGIQLQGYSTDSTTWKILTKTGICRWPDLNY